MPQNSGHTAHDSHRRSTTLLRNAAVTIHMDGLIYTAYNANSRLYQAGVHTDAAGHHLVVEVTDNGRPVFPTSELPWDGSHPVVKANAPFWLYVDSGNGLPVQDSNAELYKPNDLTDPQSFGHILNFESLYQRALPLDFNRIAEFNFPHGTCYSAQNMDLDLKEFDQGMPFTTASVVETMPLSTLGAIDIASTGNKVKRSIVLANRDREFFRFPLKGGANYEIQIMNVPMDSHPIHNPEEHFLQFYELFSLNPGEKMFLVDPEDMDMPMDGPAPTPNSPPCVQSAGNLTSGLGS